MIDETCKVLADLEADPTCRVDAFCVLTGKVEIRRRVHVATGCRLIGSGGRIMLQDGSFVSMGSTLLTASDDYRGQHAIGPTFPEEYRRVHVGTIIFEPMAGCGAHCIVMPGCCLGFGSRLGAGSFLTEDIPPGEIWAGSPAKKIKTIDLGRLRDIYQEVFQ